MNGIPFDATGEKIRRDGLWCVYQFGQQLDAMMAWDRFKGRWMLGEEFSYPERPDSLPKSASLPSGTRSRQTSGGRLARFDPPKILRHLARLVASRPFPVARIDELVSQIVFFTALKSTYEREWYRTPLPAPSPVETTPNENALRAHHNARMETCRRYVIHTGPSIGILNLLRKSREIIW